MLRHGQVGNVRGVHDTRSETLITFMFQKQRINCNVMIVTLKKVKIKMTQSKNKTHF
jgi:hypothetical protein